MEQLLDLNAGIVAVPPFKGIEDAYAIYPAYLQLTEDKGMLGTSIDVRVVYYDPETNAKMVYPFGDATLYKTTLDELFKGKKADELKANLQKVINTRKNYFDHDAFIMVEGDVLLTGIEVIDGADDWVEQPAGPRMWLNPRSGLREEVPEWTERRRDKGVLFNCE